MAPLVLLGLVFPALFVGTGWVAVRIVLRMEG